MYREHWLKVYCGLEGSSTRSCFVKPTVYWNLFHNPLLRPRHRRERVTGVEKVSRIAMILGKKSLRRDEYKFYIVREGAVFPRRFGNFAFVRARVRQEPTYSGSYLMAIRVVFVSHETSEKYRAPVKFSLSIISRYRPPSSSKVNSRAL